MSESIKILEEAIELVMQTGKVSRKGAVQLDNAIEDVKAVYADYLRLGEENQRLLSQIGSSNVKELKPDLKETKELKSKPLTK